MQRILFLILGFTLFIYSDIICQQPIYQNQVQSPSINVFYSYMDLCDDTKDIYIQFHPTDGYDKLSKEVINVSAVEYQMNGITLPVKLTNNRFESVIYNIDSRIEEFDITILGYDSKGIMVSRDIRKIVLKKDGLIRTSDHLYNELEKWRNDTKGNILYHFCDVNINKVELLAFFQEFLGLSKLQMCSLIDIYERETFDSWVDEKWHNILKGKICKKFNEFLNPPNNPPLDEQCNCKVIKSQSHLVHSIGQELSADGSSAPQSSCPSVSPREDSKWWGKGALGGFKLDHQNNWTNILWATMGAAKMFHMHSHHDRDEHDWNPKHNLGLNGELKSRLSFSMYCYDPAFTVIDGDDCSCEKTVRTDWEYSTKVSGYASANGSGEIAAGLRDFVGITRNEAAGSEEIYSSLSVIDIECQGTDTIPLFFDVFNIGEILVGGLPTGLVDSVLSGGSLDTFNWQDFVQPGISAIPELATAIDDLIFKDYGCSDPIDTTFTKLKGGDVYTLTPENYKVGYTINSGVYGEIRLGQDESDCDLGLLSRFYLVGALTTPNPDTVCCNEALGSYIAGNFSSFENDNLGQPKFNGLFDIHPVKLEEEHSSVASFFADITPLFLEYMFPVDDCCLPAVECMYGCGYWSECSNGDAQRFNSLNPEHELFTFKFSISPNPVLNNLKFEILNQFGSEDYQIEIFDYSGRRLLHNRMKGSGMINTSSLESGTYIIQVSNSDTTYTSKFVKL